MFEKEKELYERLDRAMDDETVTFSGKEAELLKDIVARYIDWCYEFREDDDE
jgi:hypothetical protein